MVDGGDPPNRGVDLRIDSRAKARQQKQPLATSTSVMATWEHWLYNMHVTYLLNLVVSGIDEIAEIPRRREI